MAQLFGFEIKRADEGKPESKAQSFVTPQYDDGAVNVTTSGGMYGTYVDLEGTAKNEAELVTRYRKMALQPEVEHAIDDIINETIISDPTQPVVDINLDNLDLSVSIKKRIKEEFKKSCELLFLTQSGYELFRKWYVDGRLYFHAVVDETDVEQGIQELRYIDPRKIRKVRQTKKERKGGYTVVKVVKEFFVYNDKGFHSKAYQTPDPLAAGGAQGLKIAKDSIVHITSGLSDEYNKMVLSHLHKAIKPLNQLQVLEDASVIYRISRAPERRIFYIDVGNLPKIKAEQYLRDVMARYRNKLVYDASTGEIKDDRNQMSMLEDFWLPRREGGRGTEITTLPGGQNLGEIQDIEYFQKKLYRSLNIPISRLEGGQGFNLGRAAEISRDEVKFTKFVGRLRKKFCMLFHDLLKTQLILKGIIAPEEWDSMMGDITYNFLQDGYFAELKNSEMMRERVNLAQQLEGYVGKYFSNEYIRTKILKQNEQEIEEIDKQIEDEAASEQPQTEEEPQTEEPKEKI